MVRFPRERRVVGDDQLAAHVLASLDGETRGIHGCEATQALYLKHAFALAARYPRVKLLIWYLVVDEGPYPGAPADEGVYTGLRRADGARKPSWYAFAQVDGAYARMQAQVRNDAIICRLQSCEPAALPTFGAAA